MTFLKGLKPEHLKPASLLVVVLAITLAFQNCSPTEKEDDLASQSLLGNPSSIAAYERTLYPVVQQACAGCHGFNTYPRFALSPAEFAHDVLVQEGLINFAIPENSAIVYRIRQGHNSFAQSVADSLRDQIIAWGRAIGR